MIYTVTLNPAIDKEILVDQLNFNQVLRAQKERIDYGGKGFNISRFLQSFNHENVALGFVGGVAGQTLKEGLHSLNIKTDFVEIQAETRTNTSIVEPASSKYLKVNQPGPQITPTEKKTLLEKIKHIAKEGDWWVLAGSLPIGIEDSIYADLIELIQNTGAKVFLDTSRSPFQKGCQAKPFLIKPNEVEALQLIPTQSPQSVQQWVEIAKKIKTLGPENVVLSLGDKGAIAVTSKNVLYAESVKIEEINPTGAGDSMVAGILHSVSKGDSFKQAFAFGIASGAATATMPGTQLGTPEKIKQILPKVIIKEL